MNNSVQVLGLGGSLRAASTSRSALAAAVDGARETGARADLIWVRDLDLPLYSAEQPIPPGNPEALAYLRQTCGIPIMADESVFTLADAWNVLNAHAVDAISVYPGKNGGIADSIEIAHAAQAAGVVCHIGSNLELGIA